MRCSRSLRRCLALGLVAGAAAVVPVWLTGAAGAAGAASATAPAAARGQLEQRLAAGQRRVAGLGAAVAADTRRVSQLDAKVSTMNARLSGLQSELTATVHQLLALRSQATSAQTALGHAETTAAQAEQVLADQLVGSYEDEPPDLVDVVVESSGFNDLLNRLDFAQRIGHQDARIVAVVAAARSAVSGAAVRLGALTQRRQQLADTVLAERDGVARARLSLVSARLAAARARTSAAGRLAGAQSQVASLSSELAHLEAGAGAVAPRAPAVAAAFIFPLPRGDAAPPSTWSEGDGVDIAAPGGTPELAVCTGTIVGHGIGGQGPSAPVLHCDHPLAGHSDVYYGGAGTGDWTPIGTHVTAGQVISQVGDGIVGVSSGPHLEIGFAGASAAPIGPITAPAMLRLLRRAYAR